MKDYARLIDKVLSGNASEAEKTDLANWIAADAANAEEFNDLKLLYEASLHAEENDAELNLDEVEGYNALVRRMALIKRRQKRVHFLQVFAAALVISCVIFAAFLGFNDSAHLSDKVSAGTIVFNDTPFLDVVAVLEQRYNVELRIVEKDILTHRVSGTFSGGVGIREVMNILARSEGFSFELVDDRTFDVHGDRVSPDGAMN